MEAYVISFLVSLIGLFGFTLVALVPSEHRSNDAIIWGATAFTGFVGNLIAGGVFFILSLQ